MNIQEYRAAFQAIEDRVKEDKRKLMRDFALSNNTVKVGDVVSDGCFKVKVEKIKIYLDPIQPSCIYCGELLTVKGKSRKIKKEGVVYQTGMIKGEK